MRLPTKLESIESETKIFNFTMGSDRSTGSLLRTLVASKPNGKFLELGTGTGLATCWILDGMDTASEFITVDQDTEVVDIAKKHLSDDPRIQFCVEDSEKFLKQNQKQKFDLIFADAPHGKLYCFEEAFNLLKIGGFYVVDDMLPPDDWPSDLIEQLKGVEVDLERREDLLLTKLHWSSGIIVAVKIK